MHKANADFSEWNRDHGKYHQGEYDDDDDDDDNNNNTKASKNLALFLFQLGYLAKAIPRSAEDLHALV